MKLTEGPGGLVITRLSPGEMGLLALGAAPEGDLARVLRALLAGERVTVLESALEYRDYKDTAPPGAFRKFTGLRRELQEMGICVIRDRHW